MFRWKSPSRTEISTPSDLKASIINSVSRERSACLIVLGLSLSAARMSARFVMDFDPGTCTAASTAVCANGAGHHWLGALASSVLVTTSG